MKYQNLIQICEYLRAKRFLSHIKRVGDNLFKVCFDGDETLFFDMNKSGCNIHENDAFTEGKVYAAPFDVLLAKRFVKSRITSVSVPENNRILCLSVSQNASYKTQSSNIYFEFTGRFTNVIITDENDVILEALRHFETEFRQIKVGRKLRHLPPANIKEATVPKISDFRAFFRAEFNALNADRLNALKSAKITALNKKLDSVREALGSLQSSAELLRSAELLSAKAALLKENIYKIPTSAREFTLQKGDAEAVEFKLQKPASATLGELYSEAKRLRQKAANIHIEEQNLKEKLAFYENLKSLILAAQDAHEIEILMPKRTQIRQKSKEKNSEYVASFYLGGFKISVGKNEKGNEFLLKNSSKSDYWFHLKDIPSAHVIVKTNKQNLSEEVIEFAAKICVSFSASGSGKYLVDYTKRQNVKINEGAFVNYVNFKTISVLKP
jgi:fibronectin/fibrinogen-binding protein